MELHTCLASDVSAFDFKRSDLVRLEEDLPGVNLRFHETTAGFLAAGTAAEYVLTWEFDAAWYARFLHLKKIFTPAAGRDWVAADPRGSVEVIHGTFHGRLLGESLLGAMLFMNRRMPDMIRNFERRKWDRNIQQDCRLLANQTVLILGLGRIGGECARLLLALGARVVGIKRDPSSPPPGLAGVDVRSASELDATLPEADHVAVLLPAGAGTDRILDETRLRKCRPGAYIYNFGRGNAVASDDLARAADHIGGAFLDVTDREPLDSSSPLWSLNNIMITPHSSCIYREYKEAFVEEVIAHLGRRPVRHKA
ncbi:MAG: NAD(P)-dependent oxidoreductase [Gammaproteobacteria bacterium]|nr:NAD(P)-dependent oxidoreductase [Gammaproteobacteria bacterium]